MMGRLQLNTLLARSLAVAGLTNRAGREQSLESQLESLAKSKQAEMERSISLRQHGYRHRSFMLVNTNEGKDYMDEIRRIASSLDIPSRITPTVEHRSVTSLLCSN